LFYEGIAKRKLFSVHVTGSIDDLSRILSTS